MPTLKHTHTLVKLREGARKCSHPHCSFFAEDNVIKGKASMCFFCKEKEVIMDANQLKLSRARCDDCRNTPAAKARRRLKEVMKGLYEGKQ